MAGILTSVDGSQRMLEGYHRSAPRAGTATYDKKRAWLEHLAKVDLRALMSRVEDQGQTSSCAANATAGAYEYLLKRR